MVRIRGSRSNRKHYGSRQLFNILINLQFLKTNTLLRFFGASAGLMYGSIVLLLDQFSSWRTFSLVYQTPSGLSSFLPGSPSSPFVTALAALPPPLAAFCFLLGTPGKQNSLLSSVVDPDTVGSGTYSRIRIRIRNKSFRIQIWPIRIRN